MFIHYQSRLAENNILSIKCSR